MKSKVFRLLIAGLFIFFILPQVRSQTTQRFSKQIFVDQGDTLPYRLLYPDANPHRKYPLVIFLHGSGERGNDNEAQLQWGVMQFATDDNMMLHPAVVIAPQCPKGLTWSNFDRTTMQLNPEPSQPMRLLLGLIQKMIETMPVDTNRIYITGLSMGGFGTFDALARRADLFAAAVPVCGGGDTSKAASFAQVPIWIFHGADDPSVNVGLSQAMLKALTDAGARPGYTQYPEVGHFSWIEAYRDPMMLEWLFRQQKN
ncbi:MAG: prolyl oligopeptidase family serine peptidase [Lewinellaceae bacterium]|nr:prolyl oligopeptidase family serine peptidase [Lewinellaceae bacterium]